MLRSRRRLFVLFNVTFVGLLLVRLALHRSNAQRSTVDDRCRRENVSWDEDFYSNLVFIRPLNILFCDVPKAASTNLRRLIMAFFNRSTTADHLDRKHIWIDSEAFFKTFSLNVTSFDQLSTDWPSNLFKFLVVRHPFQRIYSVYYDKFVNNHLDDTLFGWKQLEEDILLVMNANYTSVTIRRNDLRLDLRTFLRYIVDSIRTARPINSHWQRIAHRCAVCLVKYDFIGKIENFDSDGPALMNKLTANSRHISWRFPSKELDQKQTKQITHDDLQLTRLFRETIDNEKDFQTLIDYYRHDFLLFGYPLPSSTA